MRLPRGPAARSVIDVATGMLMEQLHCSPAQARRQLDRLAAESGETVADLAAQIAGQRAPDGTAEAPAPAAGRLSLAWAAADAAPDGNAVAAALLEEVRGPAGAAAGALWLIEPDGGLELAGQAGFGEGEAGRWRRIHPDMPSLPQEVARSGVDVWWPAGPPPGDAGPLMGRWPVGARVGLPLHDSGALIGVMVVCWPEPLADFPAQLRRQLSSLADLAAHTLAPQLPDGDRAARHRASWIFGLMDGLLEGFMFAHAVRDDGGEVTDFRVGHVSAEFRDPAGRGPAELAGRQVLELYPEAALGGGLFDGCVQALVTGEPQYVSGEIASGQTGDAGMMPAPAARIAPLYDGVAIAWRPADDTDRLATLLHHAQRLGRIGSWEENMRTGEVHWTEPTFALFGQPHGAPVPIADLHSRVPSDDVSVVQGFRDTLLAERRESAAVFRVVRPDDGSVRQIRAYAEPVVDPAGAVVAVRGAYQDLSADYHTQVAFAARYRPSGPGSLVSGDWYDTVLMPSKEVLVVVGDIAGHGLDAVTGMVTVRNGLRGLSITGAGPGTLLGWLNGAACHFTDGIIGTVVCGLYNPTDRTLRWARAGHLPPIVVRDGQACTLSPPHGLLLGADPNAKYAETTTPLQLGDILLLFTDGLIERRDKTIDDALDSLMQIASRAAAGDIGSFADRIVAEASSNTDDDACLVAIRVG